MNELFMILFDHQAPKQFSWWNLQLLRQKISNNKLSVAGTRVNLHTPKALLSHNIVIRASRPAP